MANGAGPLRDGWRDRAHPDRLSPRQHDHDEIVRRHGVAVESGVPTYADPTSGLSVFTSDFLARRGYCCESGCRHCPWLAFDGDE